MASTTSSNRATFSAYLATPVMSIIGNVIASLIFIYVLDDPSPVPVFGVFTLFNVINMTLFALLPKKKKPIVRHVNMVLFTLVLVVLFGTLGRVNLQIEGLFFLTAAGVFGAATTHFLMAKIIGPILFGRNWCGWACWTVMLLDFLPWKKSAGWQDGGWKNARYIHFAFSLTAVLGLALGLNYIPHNPAQHPEEPGTVAELAWFLGGVGIYYLAGVILAARMKDNRAFCKYLCPIAVFLKAGASVTLLRIKGDKSRCDSCNTCVTECLMDIDIPSYVLKGERIKSTECIMCMQCIAACPNGALKAGVGVDVVSREKWRLRESDNHS
ncbi:MAG: 4Fe-4S binding protein [Deltaproteobacteria bacterium]|nr:4Fe-4S binding protein [Deltaproteobacteria bacterium]